jgi:hypothetical protein
MVFNYGPDRALFLQKNRPLKQPVSLLAHRLPSDHMQVTVQRLLSSIIHAACLSQ